VKTLFSLGIGLVLCAGLQLMGAQPAASEPTGLLKVEIQQPTSGIVLTGSESSIEVQGGASVYGGVRQVDLILVLDTSSSLKHTDPDGYRLTGAIELVRSLPAWTDIQIGLVSFGRWSKLLSPLSEDRAAVELALRKVGYGSTTNLAGGIDKAVEEFERGAREGSTRVMLIFTDGRSNEKKALAATQRARAEGIAIHSLLLGRDQQGESMLRKIAAANGGSFLVVTDPTKLPAAFRDLRTTGVESVTLSVNGSEPILTTLAMGSFSREVPLERGENHIVATVTTRDGRTHTDTVMVTVRPDGCAELVVQALRDGEPVLSISSRSVEIVMDASRSMWGQLDGESKMAIAKQMLDDALDWLPSDLNLSLRVYGHRHTPAERDCQDTELLVPASADNRGAIRSAIAGLRPKGQTPLGFALEQLSQDFDGVEGERAVVLVTDGIESCGGDAPGAARALQAHGPVPVHVIGFGMGDASAEDLASLRAIADASGGRFVTAGSARELEQALMTTVGTSYSVERGGIRVGAGTLGSGEVIRLPAGNYVVRLGSDPPQEVVVSLESEIRHTVVFRSDSQGTDHSAWRAPADYAWCGGVGVGQESAMATDFAPEPTSEVAPGPPAKAASDTEGARGDVGPSARREGRYALKGGSVEIWRNLRPDRKSDWGVILRRLDGEPGISMIYEGNDRAAAEAAAQAVLATQRD